MTYWLVRAKWGGIDDKTELFLDKNYWENGYSDKYIESVNNIKIGDILLLADKSYIKYFGICKSNKSNGRYIEVSEWLEFKKSLFFAAKGAYVKTISRLENKTFTEEVEVEILKVTESNDFYISDIAVYDFMSLKNGVIKFSKGINLFIGENGSGKSQILKLLYSIIDANNEIVLEKEESEYEKRRIIAKSLIDIFKTKQVGNLVNKEKKESKVTVNLNISKMSFKFGTNHKKEVVSHLDEGKQKNLTKKSIFIPAKEVLSFFEGFRIMYEKKYLAFDKTYYNLCKALEEPLSKDNKLKDVTEELEDILQGKVEIIEGSFYLVSTDKKRYEISLIAEGLRKIGMLAYLLNNETLDKNSILFWDEPEANMHPKLIDDIVSFLVMLSNKGMQIFISTHSPYVIESFNNHLKKYQIENLNIEDKEVKKFEALNPENMCAYLLEKDNIIDILDTDFKLLDDKLLHHFNDINKCYDKMRDIEWKYNDSVGK